MEKLEATYRIVTPMFIGGAEHEAMSIRPPSVKGCLRFLWRALNWGRFRKGEEDDTAALINLHKEENLLFGNAAEEDNGKQVGGQGCFLMTVKNPNSNIAQLTAPGPGIAYLLGQGLYKQNYLREAFEKNQEIIVSILFKKKLPQTIPADYREQIEKALWLLGLLGGMGSRSRRGLGSLSLMEIKGSKLGLQLPTDIDSYKCILKNLIGDMTSVPEPPFSAFSNLSRIDVSKTGNDPWNLLNSVGIELLRYRSWGVSINGQHEAPVGRRAEQKFPSDHKNMLAAVQGTCPTVLPERIVFGLPHNYFFKSESDSLFQKEKAALLANGKTEEDAISLAKKIAGTNSKAELLPAVKEHQRRASPLFIHIHRLADDKFIAVQMLMRATFLPSNNPVNISAKRLSAGCNLVATPDWTKVHEYLNRFENGRGKFYGS